LLGHRLKARLGGVRLGDLGVAAAAAGLSGASAAELRTRRAALLARLPQPGGVLPGALVEQRRRCGKEGCRCAQGELHGPYTYLQVSGRLVYVPAGLAESVARHVEVSALLRDLLEQISAINLELLARRELD
jgi:hypothetical protein